MPKEALKTFNISKTNGGIKFGHAISYLLKLQIDYVILDEDDHIVGFHSVWTCFTFKVNPLDVQDIF